MYWDPILILTARRSRVMTRAYSPSKVLDQQEYHLVANYAHRERQQSTQSSRLLSVEIGRVRTSLVIWRSIDVYG
jgi:hypothetical protein